MEREKAIEILNALAWVQGGPNREETITAISMATEALQAEPIRCGECKHQDECEEMVLFDVNDDEVIGHRLHWCSYGERKGGDSE